VMTQSLLNDVFAAKGGNGNGNGGGSSAAPPFGGNGNGGNSGNNGNGNGNGNQGHGNDGNNGKGNNDDKGNNGKSDEKHGKGHAYGKYKNRFKGSEQEFKERFYVQNFTNDVANPLPEVLMTTNEENETIGVMAYGMGLIGKSYIPANDPNNGWEDNPNNSEVNSGSESIPGKGKANGHNKGTLAGTESNSAETESLDPSEFYYLQDRMGSVVGLTDPTGKMITKYHYDEFGIPHPGKKFDKNWPGPDNTFGFTGLEYDYTTGLNYARARYYMPEIGRFISKDPFAGTMELPLTQSGYAYVENNPLRWIDPSGMSSTGIEGTGSGLGFGDLKASEREQQIKEAKKNLLSTLTTLRDDHLNWAQKQLTLYDAEWAFNFIMNYDREITHESEDVGVPKAMIQAILFREITTFNLMDATDVKRVASGESKTASVGPGQIFPKTAIDAEKLVEGSSNYTEEEMFWKLLDNKTNIHYVAVVLKAESIRLNINLNNASRGDIQKVLAKYNGTGSSAKQYGAYAIQYYDAFVAYNNRINPAYLDIPSF
ncbi:RHS repeat domain-containing protein, partial [Effusibacillus consociatus]